ncbi:MAG TPA: dephospho-CoA kinase [Flavobacteriales bacterium]|nr:dephospho-CoA kinase [Flavobacteriales bacterium]
MAAKIIGLTGNIGSGKSTAAAFFEFFGWPVFNSDFGAKLVLQHSKEMINAVASSFGNDVLLPNGKIDTRKLGSIVFADEKKIQVLNGIVHPGVKKLFYNWLGTQKAPFIIRESALLFEVGIDKESFKNITVSCDLEERIKRVMQRDKLSEQQVRNRESRQMPEAEKIKRSDFVVDNFNKPLIPQLLKIHDQLVKL